MRHRSLSLAPLLLAAASHEAHSATLNVGPGMQYSSPCVAVAAASPGDTILVTPGTSAYTDSCKVDVQGLTIKGVGGQPAIDLSGTVPIPNEKGIFDVTADDVTIDNIELRGGSVGDSAAQLGANGAGIRDEASGLTVIHCYIHDNQDGILATPGSPGSTLTVEYTELSHNALGDACSGGGCTHNIYVGSNNMELFVFAFNWSHDAGDGNAAGNGHLVKTRAEESYLLYNSLTGEMGTESYELDLPQGGLGVVVGNVIEKSPMAENPILLTYAEESSMNTSTELYVASNTFVSDYGSSATFIKVASGTLTAHDNLFGSPGTPSTTGALSADNLQPASPMFVSPSTYDYHLMAGSPAIGAGVDPGSAGTFSLTPTFEYVKPLESVARATGSTLDVGAFQFGTNVSGAGQTGTVVIGDGGTPGFSGSGSPEKDAGKTTGEERDAGGRSSDAGKEDGGRHASDAGTSAEDAGSTPGNTSGCSCRSAKSDPLGWAWAWAWTGVGLGASFARRRRRAA